MRRRHSVGGGHRPKKSAAARHGRCCSPLFSNIVYLFETFLSKELKLYKKYVNSTIIYQVVFESYAVD